MYAGAIYPTKNIDRLCMAARNLDCILDIYGSPDLWNETSTEYLDTLKKEFESDRIVFWGEIKNEDMPDIYAQHQVLCIPSQQESFSLASVEAQRCGCIPVMTPSGGAAATMTPGKTGVMLKNTMPSSILEGLEEAFAMYKTHHLFIMSIAAGRFCDNSSFGKLIRRYV